MGHYNSQAALSGQSVKKCSGCWSFPGGDPSNIALGAGDLYVTVFGGRTRRIGTLLGQGIPFKQAMETLRGVTLESIVIASRTALFVREMIDENRVQADQFPLLLHIDELINQNKITPVPWNLFETETD